MNWPTFSTWQFSVLGAKARLVHPERLWLVAVAALAFALEAWWLLGARARLERAVSARLADRMAPAAGPARGVARSSLVSIALALLGIALAQPQCGSHSELTKRYGIDLVVALDASASMQARDVKPSRLERAKLELAGLIDRLKGDRVAIVVFAGDAFVQCPLTTDYAAAKLFLRAITPDSVPQQGTALSRALATSRELLDNADRGAKGKAVVLITDGEDHEGAALDEAAKLAEAGVRIYAVGVGSVSGEPIPLVDAAGNVTGYKKDRAGNTVMTRLNEQILQELADKGTGKYVHSARGDLGVGEIAEELDRLQKAELQSRLTVQYEDRYQAFAAPALALLLLAALAGDGRWRRARATPVTGGRKAA